MSSGEPDQQASRPPSDLGDERQPTVDELNDADGAGEALKSDDSRMEGQ